MLRKASALKRAWIFLLALFLVGGMCWLDTLDLSDDIPLTQPLTFEQQAIDPEESRAHVLGLVLGAQPLWYATLVIPQPQQLPVLSARLVLPPPEPLLYQRFSIYRI